MFLGIKIHKSYVFLLNKIFILSFHKKTKRKSLQTMKTRINKSEVMKRAWRIYRDRNPYSYSFSSALRQAWEVKKANATYRTSETKRNGSAPAYRPVPGAAFEAGCAAYYRNAVQGQYFGD